MKQTRFLSVLFFSGMVLGLGFSPAVADDGGFGSTYFTAQAPSALADPAPAALAAATDKTKAENMDAMAATLSQITPAAGGDSVFTLPEDPAAKAAPTKETTKIEAPAQNQILPRPVEPLIPGM